MTTQIKTGVIADNAVTTAKVADGAITSAKVANTTIGVEKINATGTPSNTTFLRGDGTWNAPTGGVTSITAGTGLSGGTITTSGTIALVTTAGAVGTYALLRTTNVNTYNAGNTLAGSSLRYSSGGGDAGGTVSGTWQCMGYSSDPGCASSARLATVWVRIS